MDTPLILACLAAVHREIVGHEAEIESLDRAIGDGDHFINVRRGCEVLAALAPTLDGLPPAQALQKIGMKLLATIGGASGTLFSSLFLAMAKTLDGEPAPDRQLFAQAFAAGVEAIKS